jgi:hypothetical protein
MLVSQPYGLSGTDLADLVRVGEQWGLDVRVDGTRWYGHGSTYMELRPAGAL